MSEWYKINTRDNCHYCASRFMCEAVGNCVINSWGEPVNIQRNSKTLLDMPVGGYTFQDSSLRSILQTLLEKVWEEGECFNSKRPFGDSGWEWDIYASMIKHGFIDGELDEDGYVDKISDDDRKKAHYLVLAAIKEMFK